MQNDVIENFQKLNKSGLESAKRLGEINARALSRVAEYQLGVANDCLNGGVKSLQLLGEVKDVQAAVSAQSKLVAELNEQLVSRAKESVQIAMDTRDELVGWVEDGIKAMTAAPAAKSAKKAA